MGIQTTEQNRRLFLVINVDVPLLMVRKAPSFQIADDVKYIFGVTQYESLLVDYKYSP